MREKLKTVGVVSFFAFSFLSLCVCVSLVKVDVVTHMSLFSSFFSLDLKHKEARRKE